MTTRRDRIRTALLAVVGSRWFGVALGTVVLVVVIARVGATPFLDGLRSLDWRAVVAATMIAAVSTAAVAWRWTLVSHGFGLPLRWTAALGRYYRSQFLNTLLPGGVLGDVERAVEQGRDADSMISAARAVTVERTIGQLVQVAITVAVLIVVGSAYGAALLPVVVLALGAVVLIGVLAAASGRVRHRVRREARLLRAAARRPRVIASVVGASALAIACHVATFAIAAAAVGVPVTGSGAIVLALVVLLASSLPASIGGWGPREGAAGWAFAVAGFGADAGVAVATAFGVLTIVSLVPGVAGTVLIDRLVRRNPHDRTPLRDRQLRDLARRLPRHGAPAAARPLERPRS